METRWPGEKSGRKYLTEWLNKLGDKNFQQSSTEENHTQANTKFVSKLSHTAIERVDADYTRGCN